MKKPAKAELEKEEEGEEEEGEEEGEEEEEAEEDEPGGVVEKPLHQRSPELGDVRTYMGPLKAYIQRYDEDSKKWKAVVNFAQASCCNLHKDYCKIVWKELAKEGFDQEKVNELKSKLINSEDVN